MQSEYTVETGLPGTPVGALGLENTMAVLRTSTTGGHVTLTSSTLSNAVARARKVIRGIGDVAKEPLHGDDQLVHDVVALQGNAWLSAKHGIERLEVAFEMGARAADTCERLLKAEGAASLRATERDLADLGWVKGVLELVKLRTRIKSDKEASAQLAERTAMLAADFKRLGDSLRKALTAHAKAWPKVEARSQAAARDLILRNWDPVTRAKGYDDSQIKRYAKHYQRGEWLQKEAKAS